MSSSHSKPRLEFIDWTRGVAAAIMLQGHVFDAFAQGEQRQSSAFVLSQWVGGMPPAIFLFLTGVTLAFLMESQERKGLTAWQKLRGVLFRGRYLLLLALLFRFQMWAVAFGASPWTDLLRVDVLNCMGLTAILLAPLAVLSRLDRIRWSVVVGLGVAGGAPLMANLDWSGVAPLIRDYLKPNGVLFPLFPWAAYMAFGVGAGTAIKMASSRDLGRAAQWSVLVGLVLIFGSQFLSNLPYSLYEKSDFWIDSPWLVLIKLGVALVLMGFAYLWTSHMMTGWSWIAQLGSTSLLVYWVHTELVYGRWLWALKGNLSIPQIVLMAVTVILAMVGLSALRTNWSRVRAWLWPSEAMALGQPSSAEGD
jgi:uncharacterized membrane protein